VTTLAAVLSEVHRRTLEAVCDTIVPAVQASDEDPALADFLARGAGEMQIPGQVEALIADVTIFTAHQMGSCRMGSDPSDSVADGRGELHDVEGVWIGDASAFPTAPGVNPMVSIMSLAHRTADQILSR
jgi:choline dehydrogenase-like flavoprotein